MHVEVNNQRKTCRMYLYLVHILHQLVKGVDLHQGDHLSANRGPRLSINCRTQRWYLQVGVFLKKKHTQILLIHEASHDLQPLPIN